MRQIIEFNQKDGDPFLRKEIEGYNFSMGDFVYYILTQEEKAELKFYPHLDCEGTIVDKWINLNEMYVLWTVEVEFERLYDDELE